jgi:hypothetical protein
VRAGAEVKLDWGTASERNSAGFEVQVSANGRDFQPLAFVPSEAPNSTIPQAYHYLDITNGKQGTRYYRLKQIDLNGVHTFSTVRTVSFETIAQSLSLVGTPNPFDHELTLVMTLPEATATAQITVLDAMGRRMLTLEMALPAGNSRLSLPQLGALPPGAYLVQLTVSGATQRVKLLKE